MRFVWRRPIASVLALAVLVVPMLVLGTYVARVNYVEDQLPA